MNKNRCSTPLGTKDLLLEESYARREIEATLSLLFSRRGFSEVMTPGMEYLDVFLGDHPAVPVESMYKMCDTKGRLLVMRPDSTLPIARLAATRLQHAPMPLRLYYAQDVYHMNVGLTGHADQEFQAGVEMIGASGKKADLEILSLAAAALQAVVGNGFRLEIGHVGFFEALAEELSCSPSTVEELRDLIEGKNYAALNELLDTLDSSEAVDALHRLPHLFGGEQVLSDAKAVCRTSQSLKALEDLASLYQSLCALGLQDHVIFDLGMLHSNEYYTGLIFRGYVEGSGDIVLSGGRYDTLLQQFGANQPATGFAVSVDVLMRVLHRTAKAPAVSQADYLIHAEDGYDTAALELIAEWTKDGKSCEFSLVNTLEEAIEYASRKSIAHVVSVSDNCTVIDV